MDRRAMPRQTRREDAKPSCLNVGLQMTLCLSTAMAMMVREDMKAATHGVHFTILKKGFLKDNLWIDEIQVTKEKAQFFSDSFTLRYLLEKSLLKVCLHFPYCCT